MSDLLKYKKLTDIEHVLLRPGMYVGSIKHRTDDISIYNEGRFKTESVTYNPAFLKIFDEIVSNSVDEHRRNPHKLNQLNVLVNPEKGAILVKDNGGIIVDKHPEHDEWIPELIFSNLKAGSNFDDTEERLVAGTNGVGSTLTNIFSRVFRVKTSDGKKQFSQKFVDNMTDREEPEVVKATSPKGFTEIAFMPDFERFEMETIDEDHMMMLQKRVIDLAACNPKLKVSFNNEDHTFKSFEEYCKLYVEDVIYVEGSRWKIGMAPSNGSMQQVSFVNSVETSDGGTHVDYIANQIVTHLRALIKKKHKIDVRPQEIKNHLFLFVQADIVNPIFSSQTKEKLITEPKQFGSSFEFSPATIKKIASSEVVERILDWAQQKAIAEEKKELRNLNKNLSKSKILKLIDAKARTRRQDCSLAIFEGDCLEENTSIFALRETDEEMFRSIKDVEVDDYVLTHKNRFKRVVAKTSKIAKSITIKTKKGNVESSENHRLWVYDTELKEFCFVKSSSLIPGKHKLVKSKLANSPVFLKISEVRKCKDCIVIKTEDGIVTSSYAHKFLVFSIEDQNFILKLAEEINGEIHLLVLNSN